MNAIHAIFCPTQFVPDVLICHLLEKKKKTHLLGVGLESSSRSAQEMIIALNAINI